MDPGVAIACQGGGSQTAFTAGVLKALLENGIQDSVSLVSLSGTSGGAISAFKKQIATCKRQKMRGHDFERKERAPLSTCPISLYSTEGTGGSRHG